MTDHRTSPVSAHAGKWAYAGIVLAVLVTAAQVARGTTNGKGLTWDFANYYDAGRKVTAGELFNLYDADASIEGHAPQGRMPYRATPLSAIMFVPLAWFSPEDALVLFKIANAIATLLAVALLFWCYQPIGASSFGSRAAYAAVFCLSAAVFQPFWGVFHIGGQSTPMAFLALVMGLCGYVRGRDFLTASCLVIVVTIKPGFVPALLLLALLGGPRLVAYTAAVGLVAASVSILWAGWPVHAVFLDMVTLNEPKVWPFNSSLTVGLDNLRAMRNPPIALSTASNLALTIRTAATGIVTAALVRQRANVTPGAARRHFDVVIAITSCLLFMPVVWEHYLALLFIPLCYCLAVCPRLPRRAQYLLSAVFVLCMTQTVQFSAWVGSIVYVNTPSELVAAGVFKSLPLGLSAILLMAYRRELAVLHASQSTGPVASRRRLISG